MTAIEQLTGAVELVLKPGEEDRVVAGHYWVFSNELAAVPKDAEPGSLAVARTSEGKILGVGFFNPRSLIAFRLLSRSPDPVGKEFFRKRFQEALSLRSAQVPGERSFRLCFGESDGLPGLVVDKFEDVLVAQVLAAGMERRLGEIQEILLEKLKPKGIYLRNDHPSRELEGLPLESRVLWGEVPERLVIEEAGLKYSCSPSKGQKTGFYFDQRDNRAALAPFFKGRTVLDLHCYTGAFALNAARHGAVRVLGVDSSEEALELAEENARLNGLEDRCSFQQGDAEEAIGSSAETGGADKADMILLDPPSFAHSRKQLPKALRGYARLNSKALQALPRGGILATSTCSHHVSREDFVSMLRAAAGKAGRTVRLVELRGQAKDHPVLLAMPETEYLHFAILEVVR